MALDKSKLGGILPALVTPTDGDGRVRRETTRTLVRRVLDAGVAGLVPLGGTGEYAALSPSDRIAFVETVVDENAGAVPVVAGVLSVGFKEAVSAGLDFKRAGVDAIMLLTPYYVKPTQEGQREYFSEFIARVDLPVVIYDIPYRTGTYLDPSTIEKMAEENELIIGIKACNTDVAHFTRMMARVGDKISVLSGEEYLFLAQVVLGAKGGILATANAFPRPWIRMFELLVKGDIDGAKRILFKLLPLLDAAFSEINPGPLKEAMAMAGLDVGHALRPLVRPSQENMTGLQAAVQKLMDDEPG
jgi:4-hydroxy-tetrahydrodipicolinate synthase